MPRSASGRRRSVLHNANGLQSSGSGEQITTAEVTNPSATDWTLRLLMRATYNGSTLAVWYSNQDLSGTGRSMLYNDTNGAITTGTTGVATPFNFTMKVGVEYLWDLVMMHDDSENTIDLYINGTFIDQLTSMSPSSSVGAHKIMTSKVNTSPMLAGNAIYEYQFWTRTLSATEIANIYYDHTIPTDSLSTEFLMTDGSGSTITANVGSNGTTGNATWTTTTPNKQRSEALSAGVGRTGISTARTAVS